MSINPKTQVILSQYECKTEDELIDKLSGKPVGLVTLFNLMTNEKNKLHVEDVEFSKKVFNKIEAIDKEGNLKDGILTLNSAISKIFFDIHDVSLRSSCTKFGCNHLRDSNVYSFLKLAKLNGSNDDVEKCIRHIENKNGIKIDRNTVPISILIKNPKIKIDALSKEIETISNIFENQISITYYSGVEQSDLDFLQKHGKQVHALYLNSSYPIDYGVNDLVEDFTKDCPNLLRLEIDSQKIECTQLQDLGNLKNFTKFSFDNPVYLKLKTEKNEYIKENIQYIEDRLGIDIHLQTLPIEIVINRPSLFLPKDLSKHIITLSNLFDNQVDIRIHLEKLTFGEKYGVDRFLPNFQLKNQMADHCWNLLAKNTLEDVVKGLKVWGNDPSVSNLCDKIAAIDNPRVKKEKLSLLAEALYLCDFGLSKKQRQWVLDEHLLSVILDFPAPHLRLPLLRILLTNTQSNDYSTIISKFATDKAERYWMKLSRLLLGGLCSKGMSPKIATSMISETAGRTSSLFYKGENQKILIELLICLSKDNHLIPIEKEKVLQHIFDDAEATLKAGKTGKKTSELEKAAENAEKKKAFALQLEEFSKQDDDLNAKLQSVEKIFKGFDTEILSSKLKILFEEKQETFGKARTVEELNSEIKKFLEIFASKQNKRSWERSIKENKPHTLLEREIQILRNMGSALALLQSDPLALKSIESTLQKTLEACLRRKLPIGKVDDFAFKFLEHFGSSLQSLMTYFAKLVTLEDDSTIQTLGKYVTAVLNGTFEEERNDVNQNLHLRTISEAQPKLLKTWQQPLESKELILNDKKFTLTDSSDPIDILLIGKCGDTCQWVANDPEKSRGLLGYLLDGKNRFLILKDEEGEVVARCLLRLLWDGEKAVILKEPSYCKSAVHAKEEEKILTEACQAKAKALNDIPLVSHWGEILYGKPLMALGSSVPYEYCDGTGVVEKWGSFTVEETFLMNTFF